MDAPSQGWIGVQVDCPPVTVAFTASYTPRDSVSELSAALLRIALSQGTAAVIWNQEPDELRFEFLRRGSQVELDISLASGSQLSTLGTYRGNVDGVIEPFVNALASLRAVVTAEQYERGWQHPFPSEAVEELKTLIVS